MLGSKLNMLVTEALVMPIMAYESINDQVVGHQAFSKTNADWLIIYTGVLPILLIYLILLLLLSINSYSN